MTHFVDRRLNPKGKSLGNRQRFLRRARNQIRGVAAMSSPANANEVRVREGDPGGKTGLHLSTWVPFPSRRVLTLSLRTGARPGMTMGAAP
jgi:hypothetical protein